MNFLIFLSEKLDSRWGWGRHQCTYSSRLVPVDGNRGIGLAGADERSCSSFRVNLSPCSQVQLATGAGADGDTPGGVPVGRRRGLVVVGLVVTVAVVAIVRAGLLPGGSARRAGWRASDGGSSWASRAGSRFAGNVYACVLQSPMTSLMAAVDKLPLTSCRLSKVHLRQTTSTFLDIVTPSGCDGLSSASS